MWKKFILPNGRLIIIGKYNCTSILESYKFITEYLASHYGKKIEKK